MNTEQSACPVHARHGVTHPGLFRTQLAGRGGSLAEVFDRLDTPLSVLPVHRHARRNLIGARVNLDCSHGKGYWDMARIGSSIYVAVENAIYDTAHTEVLPGEDLMQFYFSLSTDVTIETKGADVLRINRPCLLLWRQPKGLAVREKIGAGTRCRGVVITVDRRHFLEEFFAEGASPSALEHFVREDAEELRYRQLPITPQMFELAARLVDNPYEGSVGLLFAEAVTFQLLCLTVSSLQQQTLRADECEGLSERQVKSLHAARSILTGQFSPAPTIRQVARASGINETSLKRGFKALFGETIFECSVRHRMEYAMKLLGDRKLPVARVAEAVGYVHQTSFASAFRRHFGICPKKIRSPAPARRN